ncbi:phage tail protein [Streptomyces sp. NPDC058953]|uniref:phage tail protein n=1 Tax=unclassified Streptomyces TaxID=2593676 RepID=UPI00369EE7B8
MSLVRALNNANGSLKTLKDRSDSAGRAVNGLKTGAQNSEGGVKKLKNAAKDAAKEVKKLRDNSDRAKRTVDDLGKAGEKGGGQVGKFKGGADNAKRGMDGLNRSMRGNLFVRLTELILSLVEGIIDLALRSEGLRKAVKKAFDGIVNAVKKVSEKALPKIKAFGKSVKDTYDGIKKKVTDTVRNVKESVKNGFNNVKDNIRDKLDNARAKVKEIWERIQGHIEPVTEFIKNVPNAFSTAKDKISKAWGKLSGIAEDAFGAVKDKVRSPINSVIDLVNGAIRAFNSLSFKVPDWVPLIGGRGLPKFSAIPRLAEGGVVAPRTGGVPAIIAEAGEAEAVLPLSKLSRLLRYTARRAREGSGAGDPGAGFHIEHYHAAPTSDPRATAKALMFLVKARG